MNGVHDMGGMHGFGPIEREENEPVFHQAWESRVFAMRVATPVPIPGGGDGIALRTWTQRTI